MESLDRRRLLALAAAGGAAAAWPAAAGTERPDLTGAWTNAWYTHLERPRELPSLIVTPAQAEAFEAPRRAHRGELIAKQDQVGQAESEFPDNGPGLARIKGEIRASWIVDPPDGKIPWSPQGKARFEKAEPEDYDNVEVRPMDERCLITPGAGAPMLNSHDANLVQFVQTRDWLVILGEKNHETRMVRIGATAAVVAGGWSGVSVGRWQGATLVVETAGLRPGLTKVDDSLFLSEHSRVTERFARTGPAEIAYGFVVEDPTLFTRPWRAEMVFRPAEGRLFEYACHEGNYALPSILSAARQKERTVAAGAATASSR